VDPLCTYSCSGNSGVQPFLWDFLSPGFFGKICALSIRQDERRGIVLSESNISGFSRSEVSPRDLKIVTVAFVGFLTLALNYGSRGAFGLFLKPLENEFGASRGTISSILSINMIVYGCVAFLTGYLNDKFGPRIVLLLGGGLAGISFLISAASSSLIQIMLSYGVMFGVATCMLSQITAVSLLMKLPRKTSSLAIGVVGSGPGIGNVLLVPIIAGIIARTEWRFAMNVIGCLLLLYIAAPLFLLKKADGKTTVNQEVFSFKETVKFLKNRNILIMFSSFFLLCISIYGVLSQEAAYATDRGFSLSQAAWALSLITGMGVVFSPVIGWISDRFTNRKRLGATLILIGVVGVLLIFAADKWIVLALGSALVGVSYGSYMPIFPSITKAVVGRKVFGRVWGFISMGGSLGAAIGCGTGGYIYDLFQNYNLLWFIIGACFLAASVSLLLVNAEGSKKSGPLFNE